jgi:hypothetical protein
LAFRGNVVQIHVPRLPKPPSLQDANHVSAGFTHRFGVEIILLYAPTHFKGGSSSL